MTRFFSLALLGGSLLLTQAAPAQGLPARPEPFTFVTDQAGLLAPADAQRLDVGLRRYADQNGPQVVVVTVPSLGGRTVADYARALGNEWQVGQRGKNNGVVVLLSGQERKVSIQPGSGLQRVITPAVTNQIINQQMLPSFKQGNYFAGLRAGLNTLLLTANPASDPRRTAPAGAPAAAGGGSENFPALGTAGAASTAATSPPETYETPAGPSQSDYAAPDAEPAPSGGMGTILIGLLVIGGIGFFLLKMFRRNSGSSPTGGNSTPDFYGNQPGRTAGSPGNYPNGPGYQQSSSGPGIGGMLATGAAAAAGAYLGNRMASGASSDSLGHNYDSSDSGAGLGAGLGTGAAAGSTSGPDYFSDTDAGSNSSSADYFSDDNSSSGSDFSSGDMGGGGFDSGSDNSGSW